jgi:hypothetical protein
LIICFAFASIASVSEGATFFSLSAIILKPPVFYMAFYIQYSAARDSVAFY